MNFNDTSTFHVLKNVFSITSSGPLGMEEANFTSESLEKSSVANLITTKKSLHQDDKESRKEEFHRKLKGRVSV